MHRTGKDYTPEDRPDMKGGKGIVKFDMENFFSEKSD